MGYESSAVGRAISRILLEWLIWLPLWIILTINIGAMGKLGTIAAATGFFALGFLLFKLSAVWSRITVAAILVILVAVGIGRYTNDLSIFLWMGVLLWRGRYRRLKPLHYGLAFLICAAAVIVASQNDSLSGYRLLFVILAIVWVVIWFISINRSLLDEAGLHSNIVTRPVRLANRKYLFIFLAAGLLVFALTVSYGQQLLTPPKINTDLLDVSELQPPPEPPKTQENPLSGLLDKEQGPPSPIWDILFWIMVGAAVVGAIWFARLMWRDRTWTWNGMIEAIRRWFIRAKKMEALPYVEEHRSLLKEKKKGHSRFDALFRRHNRIAEWERLSNPEKVRRLYEETVLSGIEQGYDFQTHHTPAETLEGIERWRASQRPVSDNDKHSSYWKWLLVIRLSLLQLYEKAKYSPHSITEQEVKELKEHRPEGKDASRRSP
ncbi:hypothetical protein [Cohnella silvisoli]|uniref:DUF4129 domain-containing protein n=1 Tax=Cohnella silvisoli TaxID=2873699 RepID=A0ABV1KSD5_9BACL|nr:hypothetical protein [Cohnella silvisoli]MCD9022509.1 hypothetical protein [Cohnella silvisoli]